MSEIEIKREPKIRKGESGTIVLSVPETAGYKSLTVDLPPGVTSTSGSIILLSGSTINVDIPLLVTHKAPEDAIPMKFSLVEIAENKRDSTKITKEHCLKIEK